MPVFFTVEEDTQHTRSIFAPSVSWNRTIRFTQTSRVYYYPTEDDTINFIPSISTHVNSGITLEYFHLVKEPGALTHEAAFHFRRSIFYRFFGIGPETVAGNESSYTRLGGDLSERLGYNFTRHLNLGLKVLLTRDLAEPIGVEGLPLTQFRFPDAPGLGGATGLYGGMNLRYDTRNNREYSDRGMLLNASGGVVGGLSGMGTLGRFSAEARVLWPEFSFANAGSRLFWSYTAGGSNIPFYYQSSLGGSFLLRGFNEDRFIDKGAWEYELEQRITLLQTHIYGVTTDWRIDPFIAVGQVYQDASEMFRHTKVSGGLGFRAFVRPNVLGRVDTAVGGEGIKVYVELGSAF
jgi:outer membrane protein assembly factor BamA